MPALTNIRHERFARAWMRSGCNSDAYRKAGYKSDNPRSVWANAARMIGHDSVQHRIRELRRQMAARGRITVDSIVEELDEARVAAMALDQPSAAITASMSKARLAGLIVDRKESGAPGAFADQTEDQVVARVRLEMGDAAADALLLALDQQAAEPEPNEPEPTPEPAAATVVVPTHGTDGTRN